MSALRAEQSEFSSPRHISGHTFIKMPRLSPFLQKPQVCGKWGALTERRGFRPRRNCLQKEKRQKRGFAVFLYLFGITKVLPSPRGEGGGEADGRGAFAFFSVTPGRSLSFLSPRATQAARAQKRGFAFFENCFNVSAILHFTFYILHLPFGYEILCRFALSGGQSV